LSENIRHLQDAMYQNMRANGELQAQKFDELTKQQDKLVTSTEKRLDDMRVMVEEKLQKTLNERIGQSFESFVRSSKIVQKGLGEMQSLAKMSWGMKKVCCHCEDARYFR
jgi:DNA recombination protein RmuC